MFNLIHTLPPPHAICIPICTSLQQRRRPWKYFDSQNKLHWCARSFGSLWISSLQFWILILDSLSELCSLLTFSPTHTHTHNVQGHCQAAAATHPPTYLQPTWPLPPPPHTSFPLLLSMSMCPHLFCLPSFHLRPLLQTTSHYGQQF